MSAHEVIYDMLKHAGRDSFWKTADEYCLPAGKGLIRKRGRALWAKMKHADRDPAGIEHFDPEVVPLWLFPATMDIYALTSDISPACRYFQLWVMASYPSMFSSDLYATLPEWMQSYPQSFSEKSLEERLQLGAEAIYCN